MKNRSLYNKSPKRKLGFIVKNFIKTSKSSLTKEQFYNKFLNSEEYTSRYNIWVNSEFNTAEGPALLVKDLSKGYNDINNFEITSYEQAKAQIRQRIEATNLKKYGVTTALAHKESREKGKKTCLEKYGTEHVSSSPIWKKKVRQSLLDKYGVTSPNQIPEVKEHIKNTNLERYGVEKPLQNKKILKKLQQTCMDKYGVTNIQALPEVRKKSAQKMLVTKVETGSLRILPTKETIQEYASRIGFSYTTCCQLIKKLGFEGADLLLENEDRLVTTLEKQTDLMTGLDPLIHKALPNKHKPDFHIINNTYLDVDGLFYHSELRTKQDYHFRKRLNYEKYGYRLLQIREDEIKYKSDIVVSMLDNLLNKNVQSVFARDCKIQEVSFQEAKDFCIKNHIQGFGKNNLKYQVGAYYNEELVQLITLTLGFKNIHQDIFLERFCTKLHIRVVGGFSRLLKRCKDYCKNNNIKRIISFCDLRYSTGKVYEQNGFINIGESVSWCWTDFDKTYHRLTFQKNKEGYDAGFYKIYDAGQRKYSYTIE